MADESDGTAGGPESRGNPTLTNVRAGRGGEVDHDLNMTPTFAAGDVVAGRYKVEHFLARGGMGEVYRVYDEELGESVALKTILPRSADDPMSLDRFRREIQIAREVSHPNVCRIFDLGRHVQQTGDDIVFLTMELLNGVSLRARLRESVMPIDEALDVVEQLTAGLGAAHRKGIVHRDLKPSNIFLVPDGDGTRVVIADFGLARREIKEEGQLTVTGTGEILGTPAYMSPEQIEGRKATTASDIYSLGLVIYEMLTGAQPFEGESAFQIALNKLREAPTSPSTRVRGLPPLWDRTILRCLEKDPSERFADVEDIPRILVGERRIPRRSIRKSLQRPLVWMPAVVVVLIAIAVILIKVLGSPDGSLLGGPGSGVRRSVAVLGFENNTGDPDAAWISTAIGDVLTTELSAGGEVRAVPSESVAQARSELGIEHVSTLGQETLDRLRDLLATDLVVLGSYVFLGEGEEMTIRLDTRVQDARNGETLILQPVSGPSRDFAEIAIGAAGEIRRRVGLDVIADSTTSQAFPTDPEAARLYAEGVVRLRSFDPAGAREKLEEAAAVEPDSPLVWIDLANAWSRLGYGANALAAAEKARDLSSDLSQELRIRIEGEYQLLAGRRDEAVDSFRSLWVIYPDNLEYGIMLANAQVAAGKSEAALETVEELNALPQPLSQDPRIDLAEAGAAGKFGDAVRQQEAADRVVEASRRIGSRPLEADGRLALGNALKGVGNLDGALSELEAARELQRATGNRAGEARVVYSQAVTRLSMGDIDAAIRDTQDSLAIAREVQAKTIEGNCLNLMGSIRLHQGDFAAAVETFDSAINLQRDIGNMDGEALAFNNLALVQMWSGDFLAAVDSFTQVRAKFRELGRPKEEATAVMNLARLHAARGDLDGARGLFEEAAGLFRVQENADALAEALFGLGEVLLTQGDLQSARTRHDEALALRRDHELPSAAESEFALGGLTLAEAAVGRRSYQEAVDELTRSVATFAELERPALEADALNYLAEAQLGAGMVDEAEAALEQIHEIADSANSVTLMVMKINEAKIAAGQGRFEAADGVLQSVIADAREQSSYGVELEAQLAMAEVASRSGRVDESIRLLDEVNRQATARGWILVADKASHVKENLKIR